jgi:long-chain acyl-CoA synthetase
MLEKTHPIHNPVHWVASESRNLPDVFLKRVQYSGARKAYQIKKNGQWQSTTWQQFYDKSAALATFLMAKGIKAGDKICIMGSTRPEWGLADMGGQLAGAVTIGAYPTLTPDQVAYIIEHSDSRFAIVEGHEEVVKLLHAADKVPTLEKIIVWNFDALPEALKKDPRVIALDTALATPADRAAIDRRVADIKPDDTAIIVYTSGTTGPPKGAMISHGNVLALIQGVETMMPIDGDDMTLNFLPMAHVAERIAGFYVRINSGIAAAYASSIPAVLDEVKEVRPTLFGSVPRIFEKAYARMMSEVEKMPPTRKKVFRYAEGVGRRVVQHWQKGEPVPFLLALQYKLVDRVIFSKIREVFGGRVKHFITGAAPISNEILEFFWAAGFPIYEVYGMTEATIYTHVNRFGNVRLGTVGKPIDIIQDRLAESGEILIKGPTIFKGYYKNPEATAEAIDAEGWLHTGDVGRKDADGYLRIVDRIKHIIITSGGKNITPANIEQEIKGQDPLISQVHAHGDRRAYLTAIVTIHPLEAIEWAKTKGLVEDPARAQAIVTELMSNPLARPAGLEELMKKVTSHPEVQERMVAATRRANEHLARVETIKKILILDRDFSLEEDEITPTLKVKRREVEKKYAPMFDRLYTESGFGLKVEDERLAG